MKGGGGGGGGEQCIVYVISNMLSSYLQVTCVNSTIAPCLAAHVWPEELCS